MTNWLIFKKGDIFTVLHRETEEPTAWLVQNKDGKEGLISDFRLEVSLVLCFWLVKMSKLLLPYCSRTLQQVFEKLHSYRTTMPFNKIKKSSYMPVATCLKVHGRGLLI